MWQILYRCASVCMCLGLHMCMTIVPSVCDYCAQVDTQHVSASTARCSNDQWYPNTNTQAFDGRHYLYTSRHVWDTWTPHAHMHIYTCPSTSSCAERRLTEHSATIRQHTNIGPDCCSHTHTCTHMTVADSELCDTHTLTHTHRCRCPRELNSTNGSQSRSDDQLTSSLRLHSVGFLLSLCVFVWLRSSIFELPVYSVCVPSPSPVSAPKVPIGSTLLGPDSSESSTQLV